MKLPNFFVAGAPTSGTTSLYHYLRQHPQVYMSPIKEPTFFAAADILSRDDLLPIVQRERRALRAYLEGPERRRARYWVTEWDDYRALFRDAHDEAAVGEASASYIWLPSSAAALRARLPGARLIFVLRDPVERLFTSYLTQRGTAESFRAWVLKAMHTPPDHHPAPLDAGFYATQLRRFFDLFPREQMRVYLYESLRGDTRAVLRDIFNFLGVDPDRPIDTSQRYNETMVPRFPGVDRLRRRILGNRSLISWLPAPASRALRRAYHRRRGHFAIDPDDRRMVIEYYRDEILRAGDLTGRDLSAWLR